MAKIKIKRTSEYINSKRDYKIYIDGQLIGTISNGETKEFETTAEQHTITAKIDWCTSPEISINISDNVTKKIKVGGGIKNGKWLRLFGVVLVVLYIFLIMILRYDFSKFLLLAPIILLAPISVLNIYYMTLGRKKYLILNEFK